MNTSKNLNKAVAAELRRLVEKKSHLEGTNVVIEYEHIVPWLIVFIRDALKNRKLTPFARKRPRTQKTESFQKFVESVKRLERLPVGWDYGRGEPVDLAVGFKAVALGKIVLNEGTGMDAEVNPRTDGSIEMTILKKNDDFFLCLAIHRNLKCTLWYEKGIGSEYEFIGEELVQIEFDQVKKIVQNFVFNGYKNEFPRRSLY